MLLPLCILISTVLIVLSGANENQGILCFVEHESGFPRALSRNCRREKTAANMLSEDLPL